MLASVMMPAIPPRSSAIAKLGWLTRAMRSASAAKDRRDRDWFNNGGFVRHVQLDRDGYPSVSRISLFFRNSLRAFAEKPHSQAPLFF